MLNFPASPALNQMYTYGAKSWKWNGIGWIILTLADVSVEDVLAAAKLSAVAAKDAEDGSFAAAADSLVHAQAAAASELVSSTKAGQSSISAGQSAGSAAAALATQTAINDIYYGARSSDPATKPSGAAMAVGDEYFNTSAGLLKRWNGATWQASDIRTADLASSGGAGLVGYAHTDLADATTLKAAMRAEFTNVNLHFKAGESDATAMFNRATAAARRVYAPAGLYLLNAANWPSNTEISGDGDGSILKMPGTSSLLFFVDSGSALVANNVVNLRMNNVQLLATSDTDGFSEFKHLLALNGVSNVAFKHVLFRGFRGDGLYLGSGATGGIERHNKNVTVKRCRFDGINNENRNAISCIDIDGLLVEGSEFTNCTKSTMPGAIDMEPDAAAYHIIKNVMIDRNKFKGVGGNVAVVAVLVPASVTETAQNITVKNNTADTFSSAFFSLQTYRLPTVSSVDNHVVVEGNRATNGRYFYNIYDGKRITLRDNTSSDMADGDLLGFSGATQAVRDVLIENNRFTRHNATSAVGAGLSIAKADYVSFVRNKWIDCGTGAGGTSNAIDFSTGASSFIRFEACEISAPTGKTLIAIQKQAGHTLTPASNKFYGNELNGLPNNFVAEDSDALEQPFWPAITGSGAAGSGTYTEQYGRYRRVGKMVFFRIKVAVAAGHTGAAMIQVGLPTLAAAAGNNQEPIIALAIDGAATTGGQIALLNPALVVGGLGALRCYYTGTGTLGQTLIPAGAFTVYASGSYQAA